MPYKTKEARNSHRATDKDRVNARQKEYRACNKENFHTYRLTFSHGMTREQLKEKQTAQGNRCACCGEWFIETPQIDHDHDCCPAHRSCDKCRRGLLCRDCNFGLGFFKDSPLRLQQAIGYLAKYDREIIKGEGSDA